ncbi:hypothetical protein AeMF1_010365 [Aphanomyces euteiches]|nr:hypothetical protein AeMF1_010365 [Aphanomyces euteiches]
MELVEEDTRALLDIIDARHEDRQNRRRKQKKMYYQQDRQTFLYLKARAEELEQELVRLSRLSRSTMLSWKDAAASLREESSISVSQNRQLKRKLREYHTLSVLMHGFVVQATPSGIWSTCNLNHVRLHANPDARRHGLDWLTQVMYHNTDRLLEKYKFPARSPYSRLADIAVEGEEGPLRFVQRYQVELGMSLEAVLPLAISYFQTGASIENLEVHYKTKRFLDVELTRDLNMTYDVVIDQKTYSNEGTTRLCRAFYDSDRVILVTQNVPDDETLPRRAKDSKDMTWVVLECLAPKLTVMRCLFVVSQSFYQDGPSAGEYLPIHREAHEYWHCRDLDEDAPNILEIFFAHVQRMGYRNIQRRDLDFSRLFKCHL